MSTTGLAKDNIRLRAGPDLNDPEIAFIHVTTKLDLLAVHGDWLRVRLAEADKEGYVMRRFVLVSDEALAELPPDEPIAPPEPEPEPERPRRPARKGKPKKSAEQAE
jgi:hypothetical protein